MNSEKVKEIKKALEQNTKTCLLYDFEKSTDCKVFQCKYILDYINELESKNERLDKSDTSKEESSIEYYNLYKDLKSKYKNLENNYEYAYELYKKYEKEADKYKCLYETMYKKYAKLEAETYTKEDILELKKRIAELEKSKFCVNCTKEIQGREIVCFDCHEEVIKCALKQFAERLKEKLYNHRIWELPYEEWCKGNVVCGKIDETLKEFINE